MTDLPVVVDSSAIIAIIRAEPEHASMLTVLNQSSSSVCSMVTFVESFMVSTNRNEDAPVELHVELLEDMGIKTVALDQDQAVLAAQAFARFGKGRHPAKLNLGDCFSYALAKSLNAPLLFKGDDFSQTDIVPAIAAGAAGP